MSDNVKEDHFLTYHASLLLNCINEAVNLLLFGLGDESSLRLYKFPLSKEN
jgi:hypothetical protein